MPPTSFVAHNPTPQQPEPSALIRDLVEDPKNNGDYRLEITGQPLTDLWRACERVEGELRATKGELASERAAGARYCAALTDIANMPEYDQDDAHRLRDKARQALAAPTQAGKVGP